MNNHSRTTNSILNFIGNTLYQLFAIILAFLTRRVFISSLGYEYLGINGLFVNILAVLSMAELGIGTAMSYSMYKQIAKGDKEKLAGLTNYYKKLYNRIALIVFAVGVSLLFLRCVHGRFVSLGFGFFCYPRFMN